MSTAVKQMELQPVPAEQAPSPTVMTPLAMIDRAIASGASIETLERLMALQERWEASEAKKEFDNAIAEVKAKIKPIIKNRHVGFESRKEGGARTDYDYEDLAAIAEVVDPILSEHGLSYRFRTSQENGIVTVICILSHRRGHREETPLSASPDVSGNKNPIQGIGSTVTFLQRYTLKSSLGLAAAKDDDARSASGPDLAMTITADQFRELQDLLAESGSQEADMLKYVKAETVEVMTLAQYAKAKAAMVQKIKNKQRKATTNAH
jgi:hypothetical protein